MTRVSTLMPAWRLKSGPLALSAGRGATGRADRIRHVITGEGKGIGPLGKLYLEHDAATMAEDELDEGEVEFPDSAESLAVVAGDLGPTRGKALAPGLQRLGVVKAEDLDVGDPQSRGLDGGQHFRQGRDISAGKDIFGDPRLGAPAGPVDADGMD